MIRLLSLYSYISSYSIILRYIPYNVFQYNLFAAAYVDCRVSLSDHCVIGAGCKVLPLESEDKSIEQLPPRTAVFGAMSNRRILKEAIYVCVFNLFIGSAIVLSQSSSVIIIILCYKYIDLVYLIY